jgi:hypothetical protein
MNMQFRRILRVPCLVLAGIVTLVASAGWGVDAGLAVSRLRCEYLENPAGIDVREPRLSWIVASGERGQRQTAYQILVAGSRETLDGGAGDLWDSGKVASDETALIPYQGRALESRTTCWWKVRVWDRNDEASPWSETGSWTMGLLEASDWDAKWVGQPADTFPKNGEAPGPLFRKTFELGAKPVRATAYVAALGYYQLSLNGQRIGDDVCSPPVSDYDKRAYYITYDVTGALQPGDNCVGVWLGRGWYCPDFPGVVHPGPVARVQVEVTLEDGSTVRVASDETWKTHPGPIKAVGNTKKGNLDGERYDAGEEIPGWDTVELEDSGWISPQIVAPPAPVLCAPMMPLNRMTEIIAPVSLEEIAPGEYLFDMGRNLTGMFQMRLVGAAGLPVRMAFIERRDAETGKWVDYDQCAIYIPKSDAEEAFRNHFNYHAFRYVKVTGLKRPPKLDDANAYFVQTAFEDRGAFECSNELLNRIYRTTLYTFRCVTAGGVSVDCPHRERLGYGGDGQITSKTALYAFDLGGLYTKWLGNFRDVQDPRTGYLPNIAPSPHGAGGGPTWGAISVFLPWDLYLHYGDRRVLRDNYAMMKQYVAFLDSKSADHQLQPYGGFEYGFLGDWVAPGHDQGFGPWSPEEWRTFFNNCLYAWIVDHLSQVAGVLGETGDRDRYAAQADEIRRATHARYFKPAENSYVDGGQAYLSAALLAGVTPDDLRPGVIQRLERTILEINTGHLDVGMHGSICLLRCLNEIRRDDLAFRVINEKTYPGWGFMIEQGATTFWERWDGEHSQIHSTLLAAGEWFPRVLGGIKPDAAQPGFKRVIIDPRPVGDLTWAKTRYDTIRGPVVSEWRIENGRFQLDVEIPANSTALVQVPAANSDAVTEGAKPAAAAEGVRLSKYDAGRAEFEIASGRYRFETE